MSSDDVLHQILGKLGSIEATQNALADEFKTERSNARESRQVLHEKLDDLGGRVAHAETSIQVAGQVVAQTRERIDAVARDLAEHRVAVSASFAAVDIRIKKEIEPSVDDMKRMKMVGGSIVALIALGGTAFGASLIWWGEQAAAFLRHILRIP